MPVQSEALPFNPIAAQATPARPVSIAIAPRTARPPGCRRRRNKPARRREAESRRNPHSDSVGIDVAGAVVIRISGRRASWSVTPSPRTNPARPERPADAPDSGKYDSMSVDAAAPFPGPIGQGGEKGPARLVGAPSTDPLHTCTWIAVTVLEVVSN